MGERVNDVEFVGAYEGSKVNEFGYDFSHIDEVLKVILLIILE